MSPPRKRQRKKEPEPETPTKEATPKNRRRKKAASIPPEPVDRAPRFASLRESASRLREKAKRPLILLVKAVVAVAFVAGGIAGWRLVERYARSAAYFEIATVDLEGNERVDRETLLRTAGVEEGQNVFVRSPEAAAERLERHPWIAEASVERRLPGYYRIQVREHRAVAVLTLSGKGYLVGDDATLFKELSHGDPVDLPVITGLDSERFLSDVSHRSNVLMGVVTLMHDFRSAGLWRREPIAEIHVEASDGLSVYLNDDAMYVRLGDAPWRPKLSRLRRILDRLEGDDSRPEYVFLDNTRRPDRVTVRLRELELPAEDPAPEPS